MSYAGLVGFSGATEDKPGCIYFRTPEANNYSAELCPVEGVLDGKGQPAPCGYGVPGLHTILKWLNLYSGAADFSTGFNAQTASAVLAVATKYGIPYDNTLQGINAPVCQAIIAEATMGGIKYCSKPSTKEPPPCWKNELTGNVPSAAPAPQGPPGAPPAPVKFRSFLAVRKPTKVTGPSRDPGLPPPVPEKGWWARQSTPVKVAVIGGGLAVVGGGIYLATKKKSAR